MNAQPESDQARMGPHSGVGHPSPHRRRANPWAVGFGLLAAPGVWISQLLVTVGFASYSCYPRDVPLAQTSWSWLHGALIGVNVVAIALCAAAGFAAWHVWRATRRERPGSGHHLMESGDGRTRFFGMTGMLTSTLFLLAVLLQTSNVFLVPPCSG